MKLERKNLAASVHDRLLNRSREHGEDFSFILHRYAAERFLYRLGLSTYREQLVLKGAMLFAVWGGSAYRPTRDLDFTGYGNSDADALLACFREICDLDVPDDVLVFDSSTLTSEQIRDDAEYDGLRVRLSATLGSARIPLQIDVGFGNAIEPRPNNVEYPTLLEGPAPRIRAYPPEAGLDALRRTVSLKRDGPRGRVEVVDQVQFAAGPGSFESVLITFGQVVEMAPSTVLMRDHRGALRVTFDAQAVTPRVELMEQVDLAEGPTDVRRVVFGLTAVAAEGTIRLVIEPA